MINLFSDYCKNNVDVEIKLVIELMKSDTNYQIA